MLGAAPALHAGVGLQADELRQICAGDQAKVFIAGERRNLANPPRERKMVNGLSTRCRCLVCGISGRKASKRKGVRPPESPRRGAHRRDKKRRQISDHQHERSAGRQDPIPMRASPSHLGRTKNRRTNRPKMPTAQAAAKTAATVEKTRPNGPAGLRNPMPKSERAVVQRDQCKSAKGPEHERMRKASSGRSRITLAWQITSQTKSRTRRPIGNSLKPGSCLEMQNLAENRPKPLPEHPYGCDRQRRKYSFLPNREALGFSQGWEVGDHHHRRCNNTRWALPCTVKDRAILPCDKAQDHDRKWMSGWR